jgi:hypothetical protein
MNNSNWMKFFSHWLVWITLSSTWWQKTRRTQLCPNSEPSQTSFWPSLEDLITTCCSFLSSWSQSQLAPSYRLFLALGAIFFQSTFPLTVLNECLQAMINQGSSREVVIPIHQIFPVHASESTSIALDQSCFMREITTVPMMLFCCMIGNISS